MSSSSSGSGGGGISTAGLGARLEAKLEEATRRTQALADAVESLAAGSSSLAAAGMSSGAAGPLLPTPLRALVAQLLGGGPPSASEQGGVQPPQDGDPTRGGGRFVAPLLVELRGAGLERVNGLYRAEEAPPPPASAESPPSLRYRHVKEEASLELFLAPCLVCQDSGIDQRPLCDGSEGCVRSWYVGDAGSRRVFYVASAAAAGGEDGEQEQQQQQRQQRGRATAPPLQGWRPAVPHGAAPGPRLVYHEAASWVVGGEGEAADGGAGGAGARSSRSETGSSLGSSSSGGVFLAGSSASDGFACATATGMVATRGEGPTVPARARRRRRSRRVSSVVMEEHEDGTTQEPPPAGVAVAVSAAPFAVPAQAIGPSTPSATVALGADGASVDKKEEEQPPPAEMQASSGNTEAEDGLLQLHLLQEGYTAAMQALEDRERGLRAAVQDAAARAMQQEGDESDGDREDGEDARGGGAVPLSFEARVRALWRLQGERGVRLRASATEAPLLGAEQQEGPERGLEGAEEGGPRQTDAAADAASAAQGFLGLLGDGGASNNTGSGSRSHGYQENGVLAPLKVEVVAVEEGAGPAQPLFLLRLTSFELEEQPRGQQLPVNRVRILRRPHSALLSLHKQLADLPLPAPLPPFPATPAAASAEVRASFSLLAGGPQQQQRWEACRRLEAYLTGVVRLVEGEQGSPSSLEPPPLRAAAAALLRAALEERAAGGGSDDDGGGREDLVVRLHTRPCPSVTTAERQALWAAQRGRCRGCSVQLAQGQGVAARWPLLAAREGAPRPFMTCRYLRRLFCMGPACGGGGGQDLDKEPQAVLPGPALRGWDFRPRRVSLVAAAYLEILRPLPLFSVPVPLALEAEAGDEDEEGEQEGVGVGVGVGEGAAKARRALEYVAALCRQLGALARHCDGECQAAARLLAEAQRPVPPEWLVKLRQAQTRDGDAGAWLSWEEVLALRDGRLTDRLIVAVEVLDAHVVEQCARCRAAAARPCGICRNAAAPIFQHHAWAVARCAHCGVLVHRACLRGGGPGCPVCGAATTPS